MMMVVIVGTDGVIGMVVVMVSGRDGYGAGDRAE